MSFTHLEVHSHFTLLAATPGVAELAERAAADGLTALALTDTNALYGAVAFARACRARAIRPIIGMTVTVADPASLPPRARTSPPTPPLAGKGGGSGVAGDRAGTLVLLATGPAGYRSLCRLSSHIQGRPDRETIAALGVGWEELATHQEGLICLSGGAQGWIERYLAAGELAAAQLYAGRLAGIFDEDAYLTLEIHTPGQEALAAEVSALGRRLGLPTVAVQPVYCLAATDAARLRLLAAIRRNQRLAGEEADAEPDAEEWDSKPENRPARAEIATRSARRAAAPAAPRAAARPVEFRPGFPCPWLTPAEIAARFARFGEAVHRAGEVADRCGDALPDGRPIWPALQLPASEAPDQALAALAQAGLQRRYAVMPGPAAAAQPGESVVDRLDRELGAISQHGFAPLFLVVADIVRFAREHDIPVSTRGSVANSLVAFCTGITTVDPIAHGLLFERFLNPARANLPDIDLDFCSRRRDEVLGYMREKYGAEQVALVGTVSTLRAQSAVRETGKAYGLPDDDIDRIVALLPRDWHPDPRRRDRRTVADVLAALEDERLREIVTAAYTLVGQPDHLSVHPGGVVITPGPLTDGVPVQWAPKGFLITQFEHGDVEAVGLPKLDLLGIRALTVLADAAALICQRADPAFRLEQIPLDDPATADLLAHGETIGVFQCESEGAQRTLRKLKARSVTDLAVANAFFKPGPALGGMADAFVRRYRGEERVSFLHPALAPILGPTKGVLIFQEQVLRLAREIAGLSWAQADQIRRGMSHFGREQIEAVREQFVAGCQRPPPAGAGLSPAQAATLWEQILPFAGYGFNQGHATAYANVSYRSAYLKAHHPAEFFCARLAGWGGFHHPAIYIAEARRLGLAVRSPHVNFSSDAFTLVNGRDSESANQRTPPSPFADSPFADPPSAFLYMGLGQVRDLRRSAVAAILAARADGAFTGAADLLARVELQAQEILHLVQCGALDGLGPSRAALVAEVEGYRRRGRPGQFAFAFDAPEVPGETAAERLAWERHILGWPVSVNPLQALTSPTPEHTPLRRLSELTGRLVTTVGFRLPGWTGGPGFFLGDGETFVIVRTARGARTPPAWQPLTVRGRWQGDSWGGWWLQAGEIRTIGSVAAGF